MVVVVAIKTNTPIRIYVGAVQQSERLYGDVAIRNVFEMELSDIDGLMSIYFNFKAGGIHAALPRLTH